MQLACVKMAEHKPLQIASGMPIRSCWHTRRVDHKISNTNSPGVGVLRPARAMPQEIAFPTPCCQWPA
eukprot:1321716-Lingulodinium_polyedra.AAC.1